MKLTLKEGYKRVGLSMNGIQKGYYVHRLVAEAFISNPENKPLINHIDTCPSNNYIDNLEWCTNQENVRHAWENGLCTPAGIWKGMTGSKHCSSKPIAQYDLNGNLIATFVSAKAAIDATGIRGIRMVLTGKAPAARGFVWRHLTSVRKNKKREKGN